MAVSGSDNSILAFASLRFMEILPGLAALERTPMNVEDYRRTEFADVVARGPYLNHAGVAPAPARVVQAVQEAAALSARDPLEFLMQWVLPAREAARQKLGRLMGAAPEHIAITKNTGHGLALAADALVLEPGDNVVSAECEYPSVVYPWYAQAYRGIETRLVPCRPDGTFTPDDVAAQMDARTRVLTLSWVQFGTGYRADLAAYAALAHAHNALFIVDVIQGLGVLPLASETLGLDIVATGVHKWLFAPGGTGGLYIAPHALDKMRLMNMGAGAVVDVVKFDPLDFAPKPNAQRYEEGTPNGLGIVGLDAALALIEEVGVARIGERVLHLSNYAAQRLDAKGYIVESPRADESRAGLVLFRAPRLASDKVLEALTAAGVQAAVRSGRVRFSPHFYNTDAEIDQAIDALPF